MASLFGWVDFDEKDRQRMQDVVQLFAEQDTRDELGIGSIRDSFSDYFFPGTSTIQSRVRYMLFVPWVYCDLEKRGVKSSKIAAKARNAETKLIEALGKMGETVGVIGRRSKASLKRLPSNIYWNGLRAWRIRRFDGSQEQYHRHLDDFYRQRGRVLSLHSGELDRELDPTGGSANWDPALPDPPPDFPSGATFALRPGEARYLREQIRLYQRDTLLDHLLHQPQWFETAFAWEHPVYHPQAIPPELYTMISHARHFSAAIYGAVLLYNLMLAEASEQPDLVESYRQAFDEWAALLEEDWAERRAWYQQLAEFWLSLDVVVQARVPAATRSFVEQWLGLLFEQRQPIALKDQLAAHRLISEREGRLKGNRARLHNSSALHRWSGQSATSPLDYRWAIANDFARDILAALEEPAYA